MNKKILIIILLFISQFVTYSNKQYIHKHITWQSWHWVLEKYPEVQNSAMDYYMRGLDPYWWNSGYDKVGNPLTQKWLLTGAFREDEEDLAFRVTYPTNTMGHFWHADGGDDYQHGWRVFPFEPIYFNNSYEKMLVYWFGASVLEDPFAYNLGGQFQFGPYLYNGERYYFAINYDNLADAYKNNQIYLTHWWKVGSSVQWTRYPTRQPISLYLNNTTILDLKNQFCWEIVGRITHLMGDAGCPAHTHIDYHPDAVSWPFNDADYWESYYMPGDPGRPNQKTFEDWTYQNAQQRWDILSYDNMCAPIRYANFSINQLADRFGSDDDYGDPDYGTTYSCDNYYNVLNPIMSNITQSSNATGDWPSTEYMDAVANNSLLYSYRAIAGFLHYVYKKFNINNGWAYDMYLHDRTINDEKSYVAEHNITTNNLTINGNGATLSAGNLISLVNTWLKPNTNKTVSIFTYSNLSPGGDDPWEDSTEAELYVNRNGLISNELFGSDDLTPDSLGLIYLKESGKVPPVDTIFINLDSVINQSLMRPEDINAIKNSYKNARLIEKMKKEGVDLNKGEIIKPNIPKEFSLSQNYPNPFNPKTNIKYGLKQDIQVKITIYDIMGRVVKTLVNEYQTAGYKSVIWDGTNSSNSEISSGVYFYKIEAGSFVSTKKMLLLK